MIKSLSLKTYHFINRYEHLRQLIAYLIIGGTCAVLNIILLYIFVDFLKIWYLLAATIAFILVATLGFFLQKKYTFRHTGGRNKLRFLIFIFIAGSGLFWELLLLFTFVELLKMWYLTAAIVIKFIVLVWNFLMNKFVTFRKEGEVFRSFGLVK